MNNLYLCGFIGYDKNDIANKVAKILGYRVLNLDCFIQKQTTMNTRTILKEYGETCLREIEREAFQKVAAMDQVVVVVTQTTFALEENIVLAKQTGKVVYLHYPYKTYYRKMKASNYRGMEAQVDEQECMARYNKIHTLFKIAASDTFDLTYCPQLQAKEIACLLQHHSLHERKDA
ncbi:shikimate kinase [Paludicola sp. MB14-C6]|uniref:shikimate kinase n=1 Tax=Paludihabitans sp. MB14-C6 TaxID=3070656 RepID=UPI0027DC24D3|nr:shikimate kinase [Paludicola sp. MB14-C6]WMJ21867.1 shikimate kinase [Paludicola sp. MB14-C6]